MTDLFSWIEKARHKKFSGLILRAQAVPQVFSLGVSQNLEDRALEVDELSHEIDGFLNPREKNLLKEKGVLASARPLHQGIIKFQVLGSREDLMISFQWRNHQQEEHSKWEVPQLLTSQILKEGGLSLVVGPPASGRTAFISRFCKEIAREKKGGVLICSQDHEIELIPGATRMTPSGLGALVQNWHSPRTIIIDSSDPQALLMAVELAERGMNVFLTMNGQDVLSLLRRLSYAHKNGLFERTILSLQAGVALRLLPGVDQSPQCAQEVILINSMVRELLLSGTFVEAQNHLKNETDKSGVRTLNQSLMNLLLKRKIDLKTGFSASLYPDELDEMLKKVGI